MSKGSGKVVFQEHQLKDVMDYFLRGFKPPDGIKVKHSEWLLDPVRGKVVVKLFIEGEESKIISMRE